MDVGTTLRHARDRRGLSIEDVAATTRISARLLRAIEDNAFEKVPSGIFARGFIRSFAREVGLDPEDTVVQFLEETGTMPADDDEQVAEASIDDDIRVLQVDRAPSSGRATWGYGLIVAALLVAYVSSTRSDDSDNALTPVVAAELATVSDPGEPGAVATSGNGVLRFDIAPNGPCWVEAIADGKTAIYRLMQPGERESFSARQLMLRVGDPAMFAYAINGRRGRPLGPSGVPVSVALTADSSNQYVVN